MFVCVCGRLWSDFLLFYVSFLALFLYRSRKVTTDMGEKFEVRTAKFFNWCWSGNDGDDVCKLSNALKCNPPLSKKKKHFNSFENFLCWVLVKCAV